jgi:hypothetical protein
VSVPQFLLPLFSFSNSHLSFSRNLGCVKDSKGKKKEVDGRKGILKEFAAHANTFGDYT